MTTSDTPPSVPQDNAIAEAMAPMQIIAETVVGYHKKLVDGGIPADVAGEMAKDFHDTMMATIKAAQANQSLQALGKLGRRERS